MKIKEIDDINIIIPLHEEIFGETFPMSSYNKKCKTNKLYIFVYEEKEELIGYSIIVDKKEEKNMYAWYGGVIPKFQGKGITQTFFEKLIEFARKKDYNWVTVASSNLRPHMLRLAIKMGFDVAGLKIRDYGEGNKIYFSYRILPPSEEKIMLTENGRMIKPVEIEARLVKAYKNNSAFIEFDYNKNLEALRYAIKYCNSFWKKPKIIINIQNSGEINYFELMKVLEEYDGIIGLIN